MISRLFCHSLGRGGGVGGVYESLQVKVLHRSEARDGRSLYLMSPMHLQWVSCSPVSAREYGSTPRGRRSGPASTACSPMRTARFPTTPEGQVDFEPPGTEDGRLEAATAREVPPPLRDRWTLSPRAFSVPGSSKSTCASGVVEKRAVLIREQAIEPGLEEPWLSLTCLVA